MITGEAKVKWTESRSNRSDEKFSSHEQYLNSKTVLFGTLDGPTVTFPRGNHTYNFACELPERLPGTLNSKRAKIKYEVKLVMDIPYAIDPCETATFDIVNVIDLNQNLPLKLPIQLEEIHTFFFCCVPDANADLTVYIPQGGFVPHEEISIRCTINNRTDVQFFRATFTLQRIVSATSVKPRKKTRETKDDLVKQEISLATKETRNKLTELWVKIKVPLCPVSCHYAAYIDTAHFVLIEFEVSGCHSNVKAKIPIEIGTIPLASSSGIVENTPIATPSAPMPEVGEVQEPSAPQAALLDEEKVPLTEGGLIFELI